MRAVILNAEQHQFLLDIVSHDADAVEPLVRGTDASFDTSEDDFDTAALTDLMWTTERALRGLRTTQAGHDVHVFHGTEETNATGFVIDCDRSLDEGPVVLTARCLDPEVPFMGWWGGRGESKFVEVPQRLVGALASMLAVVLDDEDAAENIGVDEDDLEEIGAFVEALNRCTPKEA